jgi:hypothetical protein
MNIQVKTSLQKATSRFVEITDKETSEIKINSVPKNTSPQAR